MLTTPHILVALVIGKLFPQPVLALILAFISHFMLDFFIPHWNPHLFTEQQKYGKISRQSLKIIFFDGFLALILFSLVSLKIWPNWRQILFLGFISFVAVLPDLIEAPYYFFNWQPKWLKKYVNFEHQYQANANFFWGILTQVLVILAALKQLFFSYK